MDYIIPEEKLLELVRRIKCDNSITMQNVKSYFLVNLKFDLDSNRDLDLSDFDEISELEEVRGLEIEEAKKEIEKEVNLLPDVEEFVFAGKAIFTLESKKTGNHYTYRMSQCKDRKELYFVGLLTGTDNQASYQYIGIVQNGEFKLTKKSLLPMESIPVKAFKFFIDKLQKINEIKDLEFHHMGYCGKCGKSLTTPESLKTGLGPTCRKGI